MYSLITAFLDKGDDVMFDRPKKEDSRDCGAVFEPGTKQNLCSDCREKRKAKWMEHLKAGAKIVGIISVAVGTAYLAIKGTSDSDESTDDFDSESLGDDSDCKFKLLMKYPDGTEEEEDDRPRIAVVGKPNVGKSSIINRLLGENRCIVSDIAGTTRDAIDTAVTWNGKEYVFIDTAGLRRKSKIKEELERYSIIRTVTAVERADVVVMVIDAVEGITEQDAKIAGIAHDRGKGIVIVVNKWDAIEKNDKTIYKYTNEVRNTLSYMPYAEIMFVSALTGQRLVKLFDMVDTIIENQTMRVQTGVLNEIMTEAVAMQQPPSDKGKRLRLYYITQVAVKPPTFVIFVNDKELMHFSYTRYLENKIREAFGFRGTSLKFFIRERKEKEQ